MKKNYKKIKEIRDSYFVRMMLPDAEKKATLYVDEEKNNLNKLFSCVDNLCDKNFIVIGSGTLWYIELVFDKVKKYIAIESLADTFIQKQVKFIIEKHDNIKIINKELGKFKKKELPNNNSIFVFHFNILAYILNPIEKINLYIKEGDILYLSTWSESEKAKKVRKKYFDFLGLHQFKSLFSIDSQKNENYCIFDLFPYNKIKFYKKHERIKGEITDILIIYC